MRQHAVSMDAGVQIKAPVAGVAMGRKDEQTGKVVVLTDIKALKTF